MWRNFGYELITLDSVKRDRKRLASVLTPEVRACGQVVRNIRANSVRIMERGKISSAYRIQLVPLTWRTGLGIGTVKVGGIVDEL